MVGFMGVWLLFAAGCKGRFRKIEIAAAVPDPLGIVIKLMKFPKKWRLRSAFL